MIAVQSKQMLEKGQRKSLGDGADGQKDDINIYRKRNRSSIRARGGRCASWKFNSSTTSPS